MWRIAFSFYCVRVRVLGVSVSASGGTVRVWGGTVGLHSLASHKTLTLKSRRSLAQTLAQAPALARIPLHSTLNTL